MKTGVQPIIKVPKRTRLKNAERRRKLRKKLIRFERWVRGKV